MRPGSRSPYWIACASIAAMLALGSTGMGVALRAQHRDIDEPERAPTDTSAPVMEDAPAERAEADETTAPAMAATAERILGEHATSYAWVGDDSARAANIRRAAELLDGAHIAPATRFSFDDQVGERTLARGFLRARVLRGGSFDQGVGGICQLASTLYVAALRAGLPIDRARPHSRLQRYAPPGMDVAIAWQRSDLWFSNDFSVPITLSVVVTQADDVETVTARILGDAAPREVDIALHTRREVAPPERVRIDRSVPDGERRVLSEGVRGAEVSRRRTIRYEDGSEHVERMDFRYPAVAREVRVHQTP